MIRTLAQRERVTLPAVSLVVGLVPTVLFVLADGTDEFAPRLGVAGLLGLSSTLAGALLGFLFGVPRWRSEGDAAARSYLPNTNLERVSDWLTKILVGIGLTQFSAIGQSFEQLVDAAGAGLGDGPAARVFAGGLIVYCGIVGFLAGCIFTMLFLAEELNRGEPAEHSTAT